MYLIKRCFPLRNSWGFKPKVSVKVQVPIATASEDEIRKYMLENITEEPFKEMMEGGKKMFYAGKVDYVSTSSSIKR